MAGMLGTGLNTGTASDTTVVIDNRMKRSRLRHPVAYRAVAYGYERLFLSSPTAQMNSPDQEYRDQGRLTCLGSKNLSIGILYFPSLNIKGRLEFNKKKPLESSKDSGGSANIDQRL